MKAAIVLLLVATLGLGVLLFVRHDEATKVKHQDEQIKEVLSNRVEQTQAKLDEQEKMTMFLQTNLTLKSEELTFTSNSLTKIAADLARTQKKMQEEAEAARAEIERRDQQISQLTSQTNQLTMKMDDLTSNIDKLSRLISETERKLAASEGELVASEGDRAFLLKELKRLQSEKADLEKQFSDLSVLRTQISKLKEDLSVARRLEWIRMGIYGMQDKKGAERLMNPTTPGSKTTNNFDLNVELRREGGASIIAPSNTPAPAPAR